MNGGRLRRAAALAASLVCAGLAGAQSTPQPPLRALSSNGVHAALEVVVPQCERTVGRTLDIEYGTSASIRQRIGGGEAVDIAFVTTPVVAALAGDGHLIQSSIMPLGRSGIGVGIRAGSRRPAIGTAEEIERSFVAARSVTYAADGASREHIERMFARLGIAEEMKAKTLLEQGSVRAAAKVVGGDAEMLLTLVSEILPVDGMELVGPLPAEFQSYISFDAALGKRAADSADARALLACIAAPAAAPTFTAKGIER
jgi:molybdate transport system substrate-binding protein